MYNGCIVYSLLLFCRNASKCVDLNDELRISSSNNVPDPILRSFRSPIPVLHFETLVLAYAYQSVPKRTKSQMFQVLTSVFPRRWLVCDRPRLAAVFCVVPSQQYDAACPRSDVRQVRQLSPLIPLHLQARPTVLTALSRIALRFGYSVKASVRDKR